MRRGASRLLLLAAAALVAAAAAPLPDRRARADEGAAGDGGDGGDGAPERQGARPRPPRAAPPQAADAAPTSSRVYPLVLKHGAPFVELSLGGARGLFLLDTGANVSGADRAWLEAQGVRWRPGGQARVGGTTGAVGVEKGVFDRLDLGTGFFADPVLNLQDFSAFSPPAPGRPQVGLLGTDFLNRYRVTVDFEAAAATLDLPGERTPPPPDHEPVAVGYPLHPTVGVRLAGLSAPCRLDTGASYLGAAVYLDVNVPLVEALRARGVALEERGAITLRGVSGATRRRVLGLAGDDPADGRGGLSLELGPVTLADVLLVVHEGGTLAVAHPLALAGAPVLVRLRRFVLDPFDHLLWVPRPPRRT